MTRRLALLQALCATPTAPYVEHRVAAFVRRFVADRPSLRLREDAAGNLLIEPAGAKRSRRFVFVAHMDHPGLIAGPTRRGVMDAQFRGGVRGELLPGVAVRFFTDAGEVPGTVLAVRELNQRGMARRLSVRMGGAAPRGSPGMFDVGGPVVRGHEFHCRVCDDLAGAAAALAMIEQVARARPPVAVLLTRAEEDGFVGALDAVVRPDLLRRDDCLISIECSAEQPYAPQGRGVVVRVGDFSSVFDSDLTDHLARTAAALAKRDAGFFWQRCLMPGGTCEATVFDAWGYRAAAVCVPLRNYHNMDRARGRIAAEMIDLRDWNALVRLLVAAAGSARRYEPGMQALRRRLSGLHRAGAGRLRRSAQAGS